MLRSMSVAFRCRANGMTMKKETLKKLRESRGLTQNAAAGLVHSSLRAWQQWESGERKIHPAIAELFLIKIENLVQKKDMSLIKPTISLGTFKKKSEELAVATHKEEQLRARKSKYTFIDLFAGIGGVRLGFEAVGASCVFSSEIDIHAQLTYYENHGVVPFGDITKIKADDIPRHDILCAGFPCQPFSHIGKREGFLHPTQGTMFYELIRIIKIKKPKVLFLENVVGIVNHDNGNTLEVILSSLREIGYYCHYDILNASDFGVPQNRRRFYLVAFLQDYDFEFPKPPMIKTDIGDYLDFNVQGYEISKHLQKSYLFKKNDGRPALIDKNSKGAMKTHVSSYHKIQRLTGTFVKDGSTGVRLLTACECKRIMGLPDDFIFPVSRTQMYRQTGNSVVVPVIEAIARNILSSLEQARLSASSQPFQKQMAL